jgi:O-acetyl-ADP-ribose deacetylase (regulator of RNase III)
MVEHNPDSETLINSGEPRDKITPGQLFRGLLVHSMLGGGAMGAAYLASHPILRTPLVIKTFKLINQTNIFKEAHLAARVRSPHVVGVLDAGQEMGMPFVIQNYVDGIDIAELIDETRASDWHLPIDAVCRIIIDAAKGLHAIHQAGVIHRDVKPANLFLCGNGQTLVGDFGIAVDASKEMDEENVSGTPMFMSPEQWSDQRIDRQADIYSLGATAHLLATGQPVFEANGWMEFCKAHLGKKYLPPAANDPAEAYLFSVIERMLRKKPASRYSTGREVAQVLKVIAESGIKYHRSGQDEARVGALQIGLAQGDICACEADIIVNAANTEMKMEVGVAAALRKAAGDMVEREARAHGPAAMGDVVWTSAGALKAQWIAHAVAAINGAICLQRVTLRALLAAETRRAQSIAFPALGTGMGDVPMDLAAELMLEAIKTFSSLQPRYVRKIKIILYDEYALSRWRTILRGM